MPTLQDRRARLPAWIASSAVHGSVLLLVLWVAGTPSGSEEAESFREVGIVLREPSREAIQFDEPVDEPSETPAERNEASNTPLDLTAVLPAENEPSPFADLVAELTSQQPTDQTTDQKKEPTAAEGQSTNENEPTRGSSGGGKLLRDVLPAGEVRVSVFGVEGTGTRFVYAFDRSISMRGAPLASAKRQLVASLDSMKSINQFQILFFNHRLSAFDLTGGQRRVAFATPENKQRAADYVAGVTADGSTDRYAALAKSLSFSPDAIFFLTDVDSPMSRDHVQRVINRSASLGTTINTIEFGRGPQRADSNFLIELADQTGGQHGYVDTLRLSGPK